MAIMMKCKMCGGDLALVPGSAIATCEYCGTTQTVPRQDDEKRLKQFARANRLRLGCEFDKASAVYEDIIADYEEEAEAYWGLVLCKYGVEYVTDPATSRKIPTCHRSSFDSVLDDPNFDLALENADTEARKLYREEAKALEEIRKGIIEVSSKEDPYDIFICYKETDEKGKRTLDSVLAQDIYDALTEKGYRTFFARISLEDKLGQEYEPYIFAALNSAKVMLAIGTDYEYYNAVWVKNEWSRFLQLIASGQKKTLIPCFKGIDAYDMPKEFAKLQAQDLGKVGAMQDLLRGIEKLLGDALKLGETGVSGETLDKSVVYHVSKDKLNSNRISDIKDAVKGLRSIPDWHDADLLLAEAEAKLKKQQKKRHRLVIWLIVALVVVIASVVLYKGVSSYQEDLRRYERAVFFAQNHSYDMALDAFSSIDSFKNAHEWIIWLEEAMDVTDQAVETLLGENDHQLWLTPDGRFTLSIDPCLTNCNGRWYRGLVWSLSEAKSINSGSYLTEPVDFKDLLGTNYPYYTIETIYDAGTDQYLFYLVPMVDNAGGSVLAFTGRFVGDELYLEGDYFGEQTVLMYKDYYR